MYTHHLKFYYFLYFAYNFKNSQFFVRYVDWKCCPSSANQHSKAFLSIQKRLIRFVPSHWPKLASNYVQICVNNALARFKKILTARSSIIEIQTRFCLVCLFSKFTYIHTYKFIYYYHILNNWNMLSTSVWILFLSIRRFWYDKISRHDVFKAYNTVIFRDWIT